MRAACGVLLGLALGLGGCFPVHVESPVVSRRLVESRTVEPEPAGLVYPVALKATSGLSADDETLTLSLTIARGARCEQIRVDTWETRTTTVRTSKAGWLMAVGAAVSSLFVAGVIRRVDGEPWSRKDANGQSQLSTAGTEIMFGALGPPLLLEGVVDSIGSIDSVDVQRADETTRQSRACHAVPLETEVELLANGKPVSTRRSAADGSVAFELQRGELLQPPAQLALRVRGQQAMASPELEALLTKTVARWQVPPPPVAAPGVAPTTPSQAPGTDAAGPKLFAVPLATATRATFEKAITEHGCSLESNENRNVAYYDISCLKLAGFRRMKVLYDGASRVVRVKYVGSPSRDERATLEAALNAEYGMPRAQTDTGSRWDLGSGFTLQLESENFAWALMYVNTILDAQLREAIEIHEEDKVEQLKQRHGTAY